MPVGIDEKGRKFIETEPIGKDGEHCEQKVWDACKKAFAERECIGYWRYPIFSRTGESRKEPDILIVDRELGIVVIEVKGITIDQIESVNGHLWQFQNFYQKQGSPYQQAENQLYALLGYCDREEIIRRQVRGRAVVALPFDEGQDLVVDPENLKYEGKQVIYWMAYKSLRPCDPEQPEQRRLIWAYDEAQSLDTLKIPTAKELFGEELSQLLSRGRQYKGGINKSEVMHRCYRTPGEILTAAHAIGMGLLRPEGMLSGLTKKNEWESIGYEVQGAFREGQEIALHRPPANS